MKERRVVHVPAEAGFAVAVLTEDGWVREVIEGERWWWSSEEARSAIALAEGGS